jgi:glycine amidinotransferase
MPRDVLLVLGDELIEAPMAWRTRYFEIHSYRTLLKEYFRLGARWTAAPKPQLSNALYDLGYTDPAEDLAPRYAIGDFEPTFDAADFVRCGRDIFYQLSNVTNAFGVRWLERHLQGRFRLHQVQVVDAHPMHIDASLLPLAPGKLLINPARIKRVPALFRDWEVRSAPPPTQPDDPLLFMSSSWLSMNVLMLDERRVLVEKQEMDTAATLRRWGFEPILCPFRGFNRLGGSFHCATLDVRRRGSLQSYL